MLRPDYLDYLSEINALHTALTHSLQQEFKQIIPTIVKYGLNTPNPLVQKYASKHNQKKNDSILEELEIHIDKHIALLIADYLVVGCREMLKKTKLPYVDPTYLPKFVDVATCFSYEDEKIQKCCIGDLLIDLASAEFPITGEYRGRKYELRTCLDSHINGYFEIRDATSC
jgi:hypothetical protein